MLHAKEQAPSVGTFSNLVMFIDFLRMHKRALREKVSGWLQLGTSDWSNSSLRRAPAKTVDMLRRRAGFEFDA